MSTPNRRHASATPIAATATLAPISAPSMPNSWYSASAWWSSSTALGEDRLEPAVDDAGAERESERKPEERRWDREQDERDGHDRAATRGCGPRPPSGRGTSPQNVRPISRNM